MEIIILPLACLKKSKLFLPPHVMPQLEFKPTPTSLIQNNEYNVPIHLAILAKYITLTALVTNIKN